MFRIARALCLGGCLAFAGEGCAHFLEARAIAHFTKAMQSGDLAALKAATSTPFEEKALRRSEAVEDLKILRLYPDPKDGKKKKLKSEIVKVEDVSENEKLVTVTVGDSKSKKMQYRLTRDGKDGKWVVDDVFVKQNKKDVSAAKSVTEQMDLLLSVREFLAAWEQGDRAAILAVTAPASAKVLAQLPQEQLQHLARQVAANERTSARLQPEAQLDGDDAVVRLKRAAGEIVLTCKQTGGHWKVVDAKVEGKGKHDHIKSVIKTAGVLTAVNGFLTAYGAADKPALQKHCTPNLYDKSLKFGDLKSAMLPTISGRVEHDQVQITGDGAEFIDRGSSEVLKISLLRQSSEADVETPARYLVNEVTLYDATQEKRLSSTFTSRAVMELFSQALAQRDLQKLRMTATTDFNHRVWDVLDVQRLAELPLPEIEPAPPQVLSTEYRGEVTEITVQQGSRVLTYVLREWSGRASVDDVLMPVLDRPNSLKTTLELTLPVQNFLLSLRTARPDVATHAPQIEFLQVNSSNDFNRCVWTQTDRIPDGGRLALPHFDAPLTAIRQSDEQAQLTYGDDRFGARVSLIKEHSRFVIDQITLIAGPQETQRADLKQLLKSELAGRGLEPSPNLSRQGGGPAADPLSSQPISTEPAENRAVDSATVERFENVEVAAPRKPAAPARRAHRVTPASGTR